MKSSPDQSNSDDLEFPDWSGMVDSSQMIDPVVALALVEEYYQMFPNKAQLLALRAAQRCDVEFVL
jgi:hypothetical protein